MVMDDDAKGELMGRFPDDDESDEVDKSDSGDQTDTTSTDDKRSMTEETSHRSSTSGTSLKEERVQMAFYVSDTIETEYNTFYETVDAVSKLTGSGSLSKNRDFNERVLEYILENRREFLEFVGVEYPEFLPDDIDELTEVLDDEIE